MDVLTFEVKKLFFDTAAVRAAVDRGRRKALSKIGAFVRTKARTRILRRSKRPSAPGQPPAIHGPEPGLQTILFAYEPARDSVVIGPIKLNQVQQDWIDGGNIPVPAIMERGAVVTIREKSTDGGRTWRRLDLRRNPRPGEIYRKRRAIYQPRPFMGPALAAATPELPPQCRDIIGPTAPIAA